MEYDRVFCTQYTPPCMKNTHFDFKIAFSIMSYLRLIKWIQNFLWLKYSYLMPLVQLNPHQLVAVEPLTLLVLLQSKK